jgi:N-acyl-D-amino-acid deacylase
VSIAACRTGFLGVIIAAGVVPAAQAQSAAPPIPVTGHAGTGLKVFDAVVTDILARFDVPGATLALAKDGRLVLARGYGFAHPERKRTMEPATLFKLASVSKSVTAVTVLKLVEDGKLDLDARVFTLLPHLRPPRGAVADPRLHHITVRELLYHAGGWSREESGDPIGFGRRAVRALRAEPPVTPAMLARYMMGRPLDFDPGTRCDYSNFGYLLLGLVIERSADEPYREGVRPYEEFVAEHTLRPMGIRRMRLAPPRGARAARGEAEGVGPDDRPVPPTLPIVHFASGGWLGSAVDLARFLTAIDGTRGQRFLSEATTRLMFSPPPPPVPPRRNGSHFGMGWDVVHRTRDGLLYHKDGGLEGFATWIEHRPNGVNWVVLFNASRAKPEGPEWHQAFTTAIRRAIDEISNWPAVDYFNSYP